MSWFSREEIKSLDVIPSVLNILDIGISNGFYHIEMKRFQKNDCFVGKKIVRESSYNVKEF